MGALGSIGTEMSNSLGDQVVRVQLTCLYV